MNKIIDFLKSNIRVIIVLTIILIFIIFYISKKEFSKKTIYTVINGNIESSEETNLYLLKKETIVDYDKNQSVTAIIDQGKRASRYEAVATYKNDSYDDYQRKIEDIDKQIQTLVKDLPLTYSADISNIDDKILKYSNEVQGTTSYLKIQEYKTKLDELAYKKITILANSSPDSSAIRDLVAKRENLVNLSKTSDQNIISPVSGIVTYKIDGLEGVISYDEILNYSASELENLISMYDSNTNNEFGIKIIDNFGAYFLVKTPSGKYDEYIKEGKSYNIRVSDFENLVLTATLIKNINDSGYNYSLFEIHNEIDSLVDYRKLSCEIVWNTIEGMAVPLNAIYTDEVNNYPYVLMVYGTDYVKVPINIVSKSDSIALVENVDKEVYEKYNLDTTFILELYDELVIEK